MSSMAKNQTKFVALLRGINVGGKNIIAKADLIECFEDLGFKNVTTYIQSGNILFRANTSSVKNVTAKIEKQLSSRFSYDARAAVMTHRQFVSAVGATHPEWGKKPDYKHNALFTLGDTNSKKVLAQLPEPQPGIETVSTAPCVLFWSASTKNLSRTTIMKLASMQLYKQLTVRNHNTVFKILDLFDNV